MGAALASAVFDGYARFGGFRFDPERLWESACEAEGCDDFGPDADALRRGLALFCESLERDARPHGLGRYYIYRRVCGIGLRACLRVAPSLRKGLGPARPPLIVCGLPRTGTTLLHRLLELAEGASGVPFWKLVDPMPPTRGPDRRRAGADTSLSRLRRIAPLDFDVQHYVRTDLADECGHLLRTSFVGSMLWQVPAISWLRWSLQQDTRDAYKRWAAFLHHLEPPATRLVLKDPFHAANLSEVLEACPGATLVQTHRDPLQVVPSFHKLCLTMHAVLVPTLDIERIVEAHMDWLSWIVERGVQQRSRLQASGQGDRVVDIQYRELLEDPISVVERIHERAKLPLSGADVDRMRAWLAQNHQHAHGVNHYTLEAFGQRPHEVAERFAAYREAQGFVDAP